MTAAIVVAAGRGERLGGSVPKGLRPLCGRPLYAYALDAAERCPAIDTLVLVVPANHAEECRRQATSWRKLAGVVAGGDSRQESVRQGLDALPDAVEWVAVHDGARPFVTEELFGRVIAAALKHGGAIAARQTSDTLKLVQGERVERTVDRSGIWHAETPQVFRRDDLRRALAACARDGVAVTDEAEAMEYGGHSVHVVESRQGNLKINTREDWRWAEHSMGMRARGGTGAPGDT